jgi:cytoskeletal protein CcmA (bactofilin family)
MFNKTDRRKNAGAARARVSAPDSTPIMRSREPTPIGASIHIKGDIRGNEDLVVLGRVEGTIDIGESLLMVTREGRIDADVVARAINIEGRAEGDLRASEQIVVRKTGQVRGRLTAPRVGLDFGCKFSGSIDSDAQDIPENQDAPSAKRQNIADFKAAKSGPADGTARPAIGKNSPR